MNDINQSQLSLFRGVHDTQPRPVTLMELVTMMRTDQSVRDLTDKHRYARTTGDKQGAKRYKHMMATSAWQHASRAAASRSISWSIRASRSWTSTISLPSG